MTDCIDQSKNRFFQWISLAKDLFSKKKPVNTLDDELLVSQILDDYGNSLLRLAYTYVHNLADAQEILQDVLLKYLKSAPEFANEKVRKAWLMQVCANLSKNRIRYNSLRNTVTLDALQERALKDEPDLSYVWQAVKQLPINQRSAIHLYYQEGYSVGEIAQILNASESSIRSSLCRGRQKLKEILQQEDDFYEI